MEMHEGGLKRNISLLICLKYECVCGFFSPSIELTRNRLGMFLQNIRLAREKQGDGGNVYKYKKNCKGSKEVTFMSLISL